MGKRRRKIKKYKNYAFIDSQNVNLSIRDLGWMLDFKKFRIYLRDKYKVEKAFLFIGYVPNNQPLYTFLQKVGYILVFKPTLETNGKIKGNCDAELVLHCMIEFKNFDKAIIISGDGDFYCLIEYLDEKDKLLKLITPSFEYSSLLRKFAKYIVPIPLFKNKVKKTK
ncbi:MAG: NYN domain-containing protein [Candidatus Moranbacteria bacterium]|nr:NYN domain-containing protein [Candidatus Moranbacteria bacterium]